MRFNKHVERPVIVLGCKQTDIWFVLKDPPNTSSFQQEWCHFLPGATYSFLVTDQRTDPITEIFGVT